MTVMGGARRLAAILSADVEGFSRLMEADEAGTLALLTASRAVIDAEVARHEGRVAGQAGDSVLAEFASAVQAVACAVAVQQALGARNAALPPARRMAYRIGVNLGDVVPEGGTIYGDGVNIAARLERLAEPGGIVVARSIHDQVKGKLPLAFAYLGEQQVKNIAEPVRAYRVEMRSASSSAGESAPPPPAPNRPCIAVLPFNNMSGDPEQDYFSDGITEDIITELARFRSLLVIARNSTFAFRGQSVDVKEVGRKLGAAYIVEGSVRKAGSRVRITAQLIEADTGNHIWAERYDRGLEDIFAVQDEVVRAIVAAIPGQLERRGLETIRGKRPENRSVHDLLLRARWLMWRTSIDFDEVVKLYNAALSIDPDCVGAHVGLAQTYGYGIYLSGVSRAEALAKCRHHTERALAIDDGDASTHATAAFSYILCGEHDLARIHSEQALAMNPNDVYVVCTRGVVLGYCGDPDSAFQMIQRSGQLQPFTPDDFRWEALFDACYMMRDFIKAADAFQKMRAPVPHMRVTYGAALAQLGRVEEARASVAAGVGLMPHGWNPAVFALRHIGMCRRSEEADLWLEGYRKAGIEV